MIKAFIPDLSTVLGNYKIEISEDQSEFEALKNLNFSPFFKEPLISRAFSWNI